jgi:hypothetical protein
MSRIPRLIQSFETTHWLIDKFAADLTHEDSIAQPLFRANSFNWVLGHILVSRDRVLRLLDRSPILQEAETKLYDTGSVPISSATAVSFEKLMHSLDLSQKSITDGLTSLNPQDLEKIYDEERNQTVGDRIAGLHWHETYHVGQLEILRQVNGEREAFP